MKIFLVVDALEETRRSLKTLHQALTTVRRRNLWALRKVQKQPEVLPSFLLASFLLGGSEVSAPRRVSRSPLSVSVHKPLLAVGEYYPGSVVLLVVDLLAALNNDL